mgnify:FL=1
MEERIKDLERQMVRIEVKLDALSDKLDKHIDFIDETYKSLKNPLEFARKMFKMK